MNEVPRMNLHELAGLIERFLPVELWGFRKNAQFIGSPYQAALGSVTGSPVIIYDSEWCRVRFSIQRERHGDSLWIYYGRLHASNDNWVMNLKGNDFNCWHFEIHLALHFLDGFSPGQAIAKGFSQQSTIREFQESELAKIIKDHNEKLLRLHAAIWKHYGLRLFELFDLRRPDLWEQYSVFIKECYEIKGQLRHTLSSNNPPRDKIC